MLTLYEELSEAATCNEYLQVQNEGKRQVYDSASSTKCRRSIAIEAKLSKKRKEKYSSFLVLTRFNRKSVTVITDNGGHWNVAPELLELAESKESEEPARPSPLKVLK